MRRATSDGALVSYGGLLLQSRMSTNFERETRPHVAGFATHAARVTPSQSNSQLIALREYVHELSTRCVASGGSGPGLAPGCQAASLLQCHETHKARGGALKRRTIVPAVIVTMCGLDHTLLEG
mgnify:FL=1